MTAPSNEEKKRKEAQAALREALTEVVREELAALREEVKQVISEERATLASITQAVEAVTTQLEAMRLEPHGLHAAIDPATASILAVEDADDTRGSDDAAFPLPKDIRLPGRDQGPVPLLLEPQRRREKQ